MTYTRRTRLSQSSSLPRFQRGFSLAELLTVVAIMAVLATLAVPNLVTMRAQSDRSGAVSRALSLNAAMATYRSTDPGATQAWAQASSNDDRFDLLKPYIAYPPDTLAAFTPPGYAISLPEKLDLQNPAALRTLSPSEPVEYLNSQQSAMVPR